MSVDQVWEVWAAYQRHHPRSKLDDRRVDLIRRRLFTFTKEELIDAIEGNHLDPHCNGKNVRNREYHDLGLILRSADHIERYGAIAREGPPESTAKKVWLKAQELKEAGQ